MNYALYKSPVGWLTLVSGSSGLRAIRFGKAVPSGAPERVGSMREVAAQLDEYFSGRRTRFKVQLDLDGTPFQLAVWNALLEIPYGETRSYGEIAAGVGRPRAGRAVGMANNQNSIPIIVPCHRVIGRNGALTGYAGGLEMKARLLALEGTGRIEGSCATVSDRGRSTAAPIPAFS